MGNKAIYYSANVDIFMNTEGNKSQRDALDKAVPVRCGEESITEVTVEWNSWKAAEHTCNKPIPKLLMNIKCDIQEQSTCQITALDSVQHVLHTEKDQSLITVVMLKA